MRFILGSLSFHTVNLRFVTHRDIVIYKYMISHEMRQFSVDYKWYRQIELANS